MAVARPELMPNEIDWIVECVESCGKPSKEMSRALRELKRQQVRVHEQEAREREFVKTQRGRFATAPGRQRAREEHEDAT